LLALTLMRGEPRVDDRSSSHDAMGVLAVQPIAASPPR